MLAHRDDPIMAIATAPGRGAVGVVRISGQDLKAYAQALCQQTLLPRHAHLLMLKDDQGQALDQVLALYFPAPNSYTGEDVLELQGHGGSKKTTCQAYGSDLVNLEPIEALVPRLFR